MSLHYSSHSSWNQKDLANSGKIEALVVILNRDSKGNKLSGYFIHRKGETSNAEQSGHLLAVTSISLSFRFVKSRILPLPHRPTFLQRKRENKIKFSDKVIYILCDKSSFILLLRWFPVKCFLPETICRKRIGIKETEVAQGFSNYSFPGVTQPISSYRYPFE